MKTKKVKKKPAKSIDAIDEIRKEFEKQATPFNPNTPNPRPSVVDKDGVELEQPVWMDEKDWKQMSEDQKEFGTPSSRKARQGKNNQDLYEYGQSEWIANPDLNRPCDTARELKRDNPDLSGLSKKDLRNLGTQFGVEIDKRLRKESIRRIVESTISMYNREKRLITHMTRMHRREAIGKSIAIIMAIGIACLGAYAFMMAGGW
jgi:hypothetical protein